MLLAGLVNLSRDSVLVVHSAEELTKKELFGVKQVVSRGVVCKHVHKTIPVPTVLTLHH